jgi:hypothetical protein
MQSRHLLRALAAAALASPLAACTPKAEVELQAPKEPIVINLNVKIEHEIRVKVDRDLDKLIDEKSELF